MDAPSAPAATVTVMLVREQVATASQLWRPNLEGRLQLAQGGAAPLSAAIANEELATVLGERYPGCERFPPPGTVRAELEFGEA
jgi:hypothetical protein